MSEFTKHIAAARAKGWHEGARRMEMERRMASALVKAILARGLSVTVDNGEEIAIHRSKSYRAVMDALWQCDEEWVLAHGDTGPSKGTFYLVYGNDGYDLVADHTANDFCQGIWDEVLSPLSDRLCLAG
jgi:hypothetical protein